LRQIDFAKVRIIQVQTIEQIADNPGHQQRKNGIDNRKKANERHRSSIWPQFLDKSNQKFHSRCPYLIIAILTEWRHSDKPEIS
jgi:hypothetical protein